MARRIHSISGHREVPDDMLNLLHDLIVPKGQEPSSYSSEFEFEAVVDASRQSNSVATLGSSAEGVALECSFGDYTAISILSSTSKHRLLGAGLCAWLQLPMPITPDDGHRISAMLNRHERDRGAMGGQGHIGAWCVDHGPTGRPAVTYRSFLPNFLRRAGVIMDTSMACIARMRWADQVIHTKPTTENVWSSLAKRFGLSWV